MLRLLFALSLTALVFLILGRLIKQSTAASRAVSQRMADMSLGQNGTRPGPAAVRTAAGRRKGSSYGRNLAEIPFVERVLQPLAQKAEQLLRSLTPHELNLLLEHKLVLAGLQFRWSSGRVFAGMLVSALLWGGVCFFAVRYRDLLTVQKFLAVCLAMGWGALLPVAALNHLARQRQQQISRQLPEILDLLSVSVEAGLSLDAALRRIVDRMHGPLIEECRKLMGDIRMGMMRRTAWQNMAERCEVDDVSLFVTSVVQAERLGTSMGRTLRIQADNVRERRRQYIKALALKAPVKIVFPLVFFIFPALLIVALGPPLLSLSKMFLGG